TGVGGFLQLRYDERAWWDSAEARGFRRSCRGSVVALPLALNLILIFAETARAARCARPPHPPSAPSPVNGGRAPTQAGGGSLQLSRKWGKGLRFERKKGARFTVRPV